MNASVLHPYTPLAERPDRIEIMAYEEYRSSVLGEASDLPQALLLECGVPYGKDLIDDQDLRVQMCGYGECQSNIHSGRITLHGSVQKVLDFRKRNDLVKFPDNFHPRHP